jgi:cobalt/nickel transport system ATP-binding protein
MPLSIRFEQVDFSYINKNPLFCDFFLDLPADKTVLLKGDNGVGKTTLAALAASLLTPVKGRILFQALQLSNLPKKDIFKHLAILHQKAEQNVIGINPLEDLKFWLISLEEPICNNDIRIESALFDWNLSEKKTTPVWELSDGELKSLALAGLSLFKNRYWILDEPLAGLDESHVKQLLETLSLKRMVSPGMLIISPQAELFPGLIDEALTLYPNGKLDRG